MKTQKSNYYKLEEDQESLVIRSLSDAEKNENLEALYSNFFNEFFLNKNFHLEENMQILMKKIILPQLSYIFVNKDPELTDTLLERYETFALLDEEQKEYYQNLPDKASKFYFFLNSQYYDYMELQHTEKGSKTAYTEFKDFIETMEVTFNHLPAVVLFEAIELLETDSSINLELYYSYIPHLEIGVDEDEIE